MNKLINTIIYSPHVIPNLHLKKGQLILLERLAKIISHFFSYLWVIFCENSEFFFPAMQNHLLSHNSDTIS